MDVSLHLLVLLKGTATTKAGAAPHLYTHRGDAVTGLLSADRPEGIPEVAAEM
jgi:hypothetical protein